MKILFVTSEFGSNGGGLSLSSERVFNYLSERYSVQIVNPKNPQANIVRYAHVPVFVVRR